MTNSDQHTPPVPQNELALESLWSSGQHSLCAQMPGTKFKIVGFFDNPRDLLAQAQKMSDSNVWFGVHGMNKPDRGRGGVDDVVSVCSLSADYDWADAEAHSDADLPDELEVRRIVESMVPAPTLIIESGHGLQPYWALTEELDGATGRRLSDGFFRHMEETYGLHNDRTDMASILRVPGSYNHKSEPVLEVTISHYDHDEGLDAHWIKENAWMPQLEVATPLSVTAPYVMASNIQPMRRVNLDEQSPKDYMRQEYRVYDALLRSGWQGGPHRGTEEQLTRPGKSVRHGTSATMHHDTNIVNIYTSTVDPAWAEIGHRSDTTLTLNGFDMWCIENGYTGDVSGAMREIRKLMPRYTTPPPPMQTSIEQGEVEAEREVSYAELNLPHEFWEARPVLKLIKQAAWNRSVSPDAVLAGVMARYSATLPPQVKLPQDGTLDVFFVVQGHSGAGKSKAGKCARALFPEHEIKGVMMDRNVGSGEGLAEAFFEWVDEDGNVCGPSKKNAKKVRTKHGLHFSTDEGAALQAAAGRVSSILIPTMCAAWMGEPLGQILADPTKSRMIGPMQVRVSAEIRIQTAHGWKLFQEEFASTGLSQRMVCVSATDPAISTNYTAGIEPPEWPGRLKFPKPAIVAGECVLTYAPAIKTLLAEEAAAVHNPAWVGSPLDTHRTLSAIKLAGILCLWAERTEISEDDYSLATQILATHVANRTVLQQTKIQASYEARMTKVTHEVEREVAVMSGKEAEMLGATLTFLRTKIRAGIKPARKNLSGPKRAYFDEAKALLEEEGKWPE